MEGLRDAWKEPKKTRAITPMHIGRPEDRICNRTTIMDKDFNDNE